MKLGGKKMKDSIKAGFIAGFMVLAFLTSGMITERGETILSIISGVIGLIMMVILIKLARKATS